MATTQGDRRHRRDRITAPASTIKVGVGKPGDVTERCKATHDVPWTERCVLDRWHDVPSVYLGLQATPHQDKAGREWPAA